MAREEPNKRRRKTPWIRYEGHYSLSAGHMDWHQHHDGRWVCMVMDDASRKIFSGGEYSSRSVDAALGLVKEVLDKYGNIRRLREVITDHGSEFYANKRDKDDGARHRFEESCQKNGVRHILCRYDHPQSNGKLEKWFGLYRRHRDDFESFEVFIDWYNQVRPHMSLDWTSLETPEKAFWSKLQGYVLGNFLSRAEPKEEAEL